MHNDRLDYTQGVASTLLEAIHHGGASLEQVKEFSGSETLLKMMEAAGGKEFYPMVVTFDEQNNPLWVLLSVASNVVEFLSDILTVISIMNTKSICLCLDGYIKTPEAGQINENMSLEQLHALETEGIYSALVFMSFDVEDGLAERHLLYKTNEDGEVEVLSDKTVEIENKDLKDTSQHFQIVFGALEKVLADDVYDRIKDFWIDFITTEEISEPFFNNTEVTREEALIAFDKVMNTEDGKRYAQCIIEEGLLGGSLLFSFVKPEAVSRTHDEIFDHLEQETEIGKCLTEARLTP